jgi:hypothetical protein
MTSQPAAILCSHVAAATHPILKAIRTEAVVAQDSGWQFLCGVIDDDPAEAKVWAVSEVLRLDPSIGEIIDAPVGSTFVKRNSRWVKCEP